MITLDQYFKGRDATYAAELSDTLRRNSEETVTRVNALLVLAAEESVGPQTVHGSEVASGWRPKAVNDRTANAAQGTSNHLICKACDLHDTGARDFARWCLRNTVPLCYPAGKPDLLAEIGLWMENPMWTPNWVHLQSVPPQSGKRIYVPSENPPLAEALPEQERAAAFA